jgi:hypothetical protein
MLQNFDLAIAWDWEYDRYFIHLIEEILQNRKLRTYRVEYCNVEETIHNCKKNLLRFNYFFDRTSENEFFPIKRHFEKSGVDIINPYKNTKRSNDKATMHLEFITGGINVPYTIIISPYSSKREVEFSLTKLARLGRPFIIKPANNTGGGIGVVTGAETLRDIIEFRQHQKDDKYLIQEKVIPRYLNGYKAWFRCFYAFGKVFLSWWDEISHRYELVSAYQENLYHLFKLRKIMNQIQKICQLDFFSSEITLTGNNEYVVVDYVNDICDMRPQSQSYDGVPDHLIREIIIGLANFVKHKRKQRYV